MTDDWPIKQLQQAFDQSVRCNVAAAIIHKLLQKSNNAVAVVTRHDMLPAGAIPSVWRTVE